MIDRLAAGAAALSEWFTKNSKLLVVCFAVGLICHFQMYSQGLTVFDGAVSTDNVDGYGRYLSGSWDVSLGRWGLAVASFAKFGLCSPVIVSAITLAIFSIGIAAIVDFLGIAKPCLRYLAGIVMMVTPFVSSSLVYYYCSNSYALCFLCAVLAVVLQGHAEGKFSWRRIVVSSLLIAFALSCYQSAMGVFCAFGLVSMAVELFDGADSRKVARHFGRLLLALAVGTVLYLLANKAVLAVTGLAMGSYAGASSISPEGIIVHLPATVALAYTSFVRVMFTQGSFGNGFMEPLGMLLFVLAIAFLIAIAAKGKGKGVGVLVCVALLPLAANIVLLAVPEYGEPSTPMLGGFVVSLALLPALAQRCCSPLPEGEGMGDGALAGRNARRVAYAASCVALALLSWSYALQSNADSEVMRIEQNQVNSLATRVVDDLQSNANVQAGAKVLIAGAPQDGNYPRTSSFRSSISSYAELGIISSGEYYTNLRSWHSFTKEFAGVDLPFCSSEEYRAIGRSAEFEAMPNYPNEGSIATIDGIVVVKISNAVGWV